MATKAIASVLLSDLVKDADKSGASYDDYDVVDAFRRLALRDSEDGGGPLCAADIAALEQIRTIRPLSDLVEESNEEPQHRQRYSRLALIDADGKPMLLLVHPNESRH